MSYLPLRERILAAKAALALALTGCAYSGGVRAPALLGAVPEQSRAEGKATILTETGTIPDIHFTLNAVTFSYQVGPGLVEAIEGSLGTLLSEVESAPEPSSDSRFIVVPRLAYSSRQVSSLNAEIDLEITIDVLDEDTRNLLRRYESGRRVFYSQPASASALGFLTGLLLLIPAPITIPLAVGIEGRHGRDVLEDGIRDSLLSIRSQFALERDRLLITRSSPSPPSSTTPKMVVGTCFAVSPDGLLVTAAHVVEGADEVRVRLSDGREIGAQVERTSAATDLALLRIAGKPPAYLAPAQAGALRSGDRVFSFGYPALELLGAEVKFTEGSISALSGPGGDATFVQVSVPVHPGNSGGPLVTEDGTLAGVVLATAKVESFFKAFGVLPQNVSWGVKAEYLSALMEQEPLPIQPKLSREDAIDRARRAVCLTVRQAN